MFATRVPWLFALAACGAATPDPRVEPDAAVTPGDATAAFGGVAVPYDRAIQASAHNAFEREEPLLDQLIYDRIRSLELDIHASKEGVDAAPGAWFVYHEDLPLNRESSCTMLADCLRLLAAFHAATPDHEVVTLWLDLKAPFAAGHDVAELDAAVANALGRDAIVTPADLIARCPGAADVRAAVTGDCAFPTLGALRGKFIIAVTGGTLCTESDLVTRYGGAVPRERLAFVAPGITGSCPIDAYDAHRDIVMLNLVFDQRAEVAGVRARGLVARVYRGLFSLNNADDFLVAKQLGTNHIAMDMLNVDEDPWASTHSSTGYPFECTGCEPPAIESGSLFALHATSGDIGANSDSLFAAYAEAAGDGTVQAIVSVPSSHVEADAKACVIARASIAPDAPSVSLCRPFDRGAPVLLVRTVAGGATTAKIATPIAGFRAETVAFLRLALVARDVIASTSIDGLVWTELGRVTIDAPLPVRGVGVASKAATPVKAVFASLSGITPTTKAPIGAGVSGE